MVRWFVQVAPSLAAVGVAAVAAGAAAAEARQGNIPQGVWVLNQARSHKLSPVKQTLWMIKDDGREMMWVSVEEDPAGHTQIASWSGSYDSAPVAAAGSGMLNRLTSSQPGHVRNYGEVPKVGSYDEACVVSEAGKRMRCEGALTTAQGRQPYVEDFDWYGPSPPLVLPSR